ncbi:MAG: PP0621 family protein [Glaciimonas sp.]|nr:PP0621 family protein [Glaciimonas sp.]
MKIAILLIIALAVIVWLQRLKKKLVDKVNEAARQAEQFQRDAANGGANSHDGIHPSVSGITPQVEVMVACAHCGLHFPASEAVTDHAGAVFCGEEHLRLHAVHVP